MCESYRTHTQQRRQQPIPTTSYQYLHPDKAMTPQLSSIAEMSPHSEMPLLTWTKDDKYLISTDPSLIPLDSLNDDIFGAEDFNWGCPLPTNALQTLVNRSLCFGLYELPERKATSSSSSILEESTSTQTRDQNQHPPVTIAPPNPVPKLIGFSRLITDLVSVHYLTDVYILPAYRSHGLGIWMIQCIDEVFLATPYLRGMILITERGSRTEDFYRRYLNMGDLAGGGFCMDRKGGGA